MDPLAAKGGETALRFAADRAADLLKQARERQVEDVGRCEKFLEAASAAIDGLEREYDEILVDARHVGEDSGRTDALARRIDLYLTVDRLRPRLQESIEGLSVYCAEFRERADRYLQWPWRRTDRRHAVEEFARLLDDLRSYLRSLDEGGLQYRSAGTGVGIRALLAIRDALTVPPSLRREPPAAMATRFQDERDKEPMMEQIARIRRTIEQLRHSFAR